MTTIREFPFPRPAPFTSSDDAPFWDGVREHVLKLPRCAKCSKFQFPPGPSCTQCGLAELTWLEIAAPVTGTLHSFTIVQRSFVEFTNQSPYVVVVVDVDQAPGVRMVGNLLDVDPDPSKLRLDSPLTLVWGHYANNIVLPQWVETHSSLK